MNPQLPESQPDILDVDELLSRCLGSIQLAERIIATFQSGFEVDLNELEKAVETRNAELTASIAHRLKGASASVSAHVLRNRAAQIENLARQNHLTEVPLHLEQLRGDWQRFTQHAARRD